MGLGGSLRGPGHEQGEGPPALLGRLVTRRRFIGGVAGLAGSAYLADFAGAGPLAFKPFQVLAAAAETLAPPSRVADFTIAAERGTDLVLLDFEFYGFTLQQVKGVPTLVPTVTATAPAPGTAATTTNLIVVQLPPQCMGEAVYPVSPTAQSYESTGPLAVDPPPIVSALGGPSRLVFTLQAGVDVPLPTMTVEDLLDWSNWSLVVPTTAQVNPPGPNGYPLPYAPGPFETSIEFPYALFIAPVVYVSSSGSSKEEISPAYTTFFNTRTKPLLNAGISDLWTATLARTNSLAGTIERLPVPPPEVVAVWASDYYYEATFAAPPPGATPEDVVYYQPAAPK